MFMLSAAGTERKTNVSDSKKKKKFWCNEEIVENNENLGPREKNYLFYFRNKLTSLFINHLDVVRGISILHTNFSLLNTEQRSYIKVWSIRKHSENTSENVRIWWLGSNWPKITLI
jgi:hypothetical protein